MIQFYQDVAQANDHVTITEMGKTDAGVPLHLVLISSDNGLDVADVVNDPRPVLLILNAIHPGEPDGIDASMAFTRDLAFDETNYASFIINILNF